MVLTRNCSDFREMHDAGAWHAGILCVYVDRDPGKSLSYTDIVEAIASLEAYAQQTVWNLAGEFVSLNALSPGEP